MSTLYDIALDYTKALDGLDEEKPQQELFERLDKINNEFNEKAKNIAFLVSELQEQCDVISYEIQRLSNRKAKKEKTIQRLKEYLAKEMEFTGKNKIETPTHTIAIKNSLKTEVSDDFINGALDNHKDQYLNKKVSFTPVKQLIKEDIKNHSLDCPYAKLVENKNLLIL